MMLRRENRHRKVVRTVATLVGFAVLWITAGFDAAVHLEAQALAAKPEAISEVCGTENVLAGKKPFATQDIAGDSAVVTDGVVAVEGSEWDGPAGITWQTAAGSVTYDLGAPRTVSAVYFQGDANDTYRVSGALDGRTDSYRLLAEIENVVGSRGAGLRARSVTFSPAKVRFIRVGDGNGDGFYSISELAAYCRTPTPFPPLLRTVSPPPAAVDASPAVASEGNQASDAPTGSRVQLLVAAAILAAIGWWKGVAKSPPAAGSASKDPSSPRRGGHNLLRVLFLASGCAALIYEVVWLHLLRLVIGASALSVGIVLASFMGGMFIGSLFFARFVPATRNPLRIYALLELGIGVFGLLMPAVLPAVRSIYVGLVGYGALGIALRAVIAATLLLPPTALMGATLPAVARRYSQGRRGMSELASLYAANTAGAVLGCLLSAFVLLAFWDVWVATLAAVAINFAIGAAGLYLARTNTHDVAATAEGTAPAVETLPPAPLSAVSQEARAIYLATALSGLTALGAQVVWTRLLTLLFGATVYAFAIILAVFLSGLGLGSAVAAYLLRRGQNAARGLAATQFLLIPALLLSAVLLADVLPFASPAQHTAIGPLHALHVLRALDVILPAAVLWGMSFPFALAAAGAGQHDTGRSSGHVYAANTMGAIAGALGVSFWIIPNHGTKWAEQALVVIAALSAAALYRTLWKTRPASAERGHRRPSAALPFLALAAGAAATAVLPGISRAFLAHGRYIWWVDPRDQYLFVSEGAASTVAVHVGPDGFRNFHVSGRVEASNNPNDMRLQRLLGHLSALAHPNPESVLVVGLGAGVTAGAIALHPEVKRIVICEIEPRVVGAAKQFAAENYGVLTDPRVEVVFDDARHFLATTHERFDIITSDPIHPWVRGNSVLFSKEYYAIVGSRLRPGGIATQWVPLYETSEQAIKIQMQTFMTAFPNGTVWNSAVGGNGYDVVLLGTQQPLHLDLASIQKRLDASPRIVESLRQVRIRSLADLIATYGTQGGDMHAWLAGTSENRDFSLKLEYISGLALNDNSADPIYAHMIADRAFPTNLFSGPPELIAAVRRRFK
jgi:spermidine synthase